MKTEFETFKENLESNFLKEFPKGFIRVWQNKHGLGGECINVTVGLLNYHGICGNIIENDPMLHKFLVFCYENNETVLVSGSLAVKTTDKYKAFDCVKTKYRKKSGSLPDIEKHLSKFFKKLRDIVNEQGENIYKSDVYKDYIF